MFARGIKYAVLAAVLAFAVSGCVVEPAAPVAVVPAYGYYPGYYAYPTYYGYYYAAPAYGSVWGGGYWY